MTLISKRRHPIFYRVLLSLAFLSTVYAVGNIAPNRGGRSTLANGRPAFRAPIIQSNRLNQLPVESSKPVNNGTAKECDPLLCQLPKCFCGRNRIPGDLPPQQVPQMILVTFDDSINDINFPFYSELFLRGNRTNPNGCPILGTFYVSHEWNDYSMVERLYAAGNEIASHSITHSGGRNFAYQRWMNEIVGQKRILSRLGNVNLEDIRGMRGPFLQAGGETQFSVLKENGFLYDSTLTTANPSLWPYTLEYRIPHPCHLPPCPWQSYAGLWEVPLAMLNGYNKKGCSMADSCYYSNTTETVEETLKANFERHYNGNRAPLGLYFHYAWFTQPHHKEGFLKFIDWTLQKPDVYYVTTTQLIEWMKDPTPVQAVAHFPAWKCRQARSEASCIKPNVCTYKFKGQHRYVRTCAQCPKNYPWVDNIDGE